MPSRTVIVGSRIGLHARPAALIAEVVGASGVPVTLATQDGTPVDAGSPLMVMTLGAKHGTALTVTTEDPELLDRIVDLVARDHDAA